MSALEQHYRISEVAASLHVSDETATRMFRDDPRVLKFGHGGISGKRKYVTLLIPETAVSAALDRLREQPLEACHPAPRPPRIIKLRDLNARVPKQPRNILKMHARQQAPDRERVA